MMTPISVVLGFHASQEPGLHKVQLFLMVPTMYDLDGYT